MPRFERIVVVDWSAAAVPKVGKDSIWSAVATDGSVSMTNHATRAAFCRWFESSLATARGATFVGLDFSFGYPTGFAAAIAGRTEGPPWRQVWQALASLVIDTDDNANNRFEVAGTLNAAVSPGPGPLWGCPVHWEGPALSARKAPGFPHAGLAEFRSTELAMRAAGHRVFSGWQLYGAGAVGSQMLLGIALLERLRTGPLGERLVIWPFESGFVPDPEHLRDDAIVVAEVWPGIIALDPGRHPVRDAAQVIGLAEHLAAAADDAWSQWFAPPISDPMAAVAEIEEGWILGAGCLGSLGPSEMGAGR